jgi:formylglycine-generating enzyme required for sulfatase activity
MNTERPVERVSWLDATEFCFRLSQRTAASTPCQAQLEYACRAGTATPLHFGATLTPELANYNGNYAYADGPQGIDREQTTPAGMFAANAWDLHDIHGNVYECCLDHWHQGYVGAPADGIACLSSTDQQQQSTPKAEGDGTDDSEPRLLRGGSCGYFPGGCSSAYRNHSRPDVAYDDVGFLVVCFVVCFPQGPSLNP